MWNLTTTMAYPKIPCFTLLPCGRLSLCWRCSPVRPLVNFQTSSQVLNKYNSFLEREEEGVRRLWKLVNNIYLGTMKETKGRGCKKIIEIG